MYKRLHVVVCGVFFLFVAASPAFGMGKGLAVKGRTIISQRPSFALTSPSDLHLVHSGSVEHPAESSVTRTFFLIREQKKELEELLIVQVADRTNPQAGPMVLPALRPYEEKRLYLRGRVKKGDMEIEYMIQLMAWNPDAPALEPIVQKGVSIPAHWALQGQILFQPQSEHAILLRYSRDVGSFKLNVSEEGKNWDKEAISGNEKKVMRTFEKNVVEMIDSLRMQIP